MRCGIWVILIGLAGCVTLNPVTMVRLATMNPLDADPGAIAVQLALPEGVGTVDGSAALTIQMAFADGEEVSERFELEDLPEGVWRVARADREALRALQARAVVAEEADRDGTNGSFSVGFQPCAMGYGPGVGARFSIAIQLEIGGRFLPLVNGARISDIYIEEDVEAVPACRG